MTHSTQAGIVRSSSEIARIKQDLLAMNPPQRLYHVTHEGRLSRIATEGLLPGQRRALGGRSYDSHVAGGVFLTGPSGLPFWYHAAEQWAHHEADDLVAEGWIPVVLRVTAYRCKEDELGSNDAGHPAFKCKEEIPPERIELWNGNEWLPIADYERLDPTLAVDDEGYVLPSRKNVLLPKPGGIEANPSYLIKKGQFPQLVIGQVSRESVYRYGNWEIVVEPVRPNFWKVHAGQPGKRETLLRAAPATTQPGAVCGAKISVDVQEALDALGKPEKEHLYEIWTRLTRMNRNALALARRMRGIRPPDRASQARAMETARDAAEKGESGMSTKLAFDWWQDLPLDARLGIIEDSLRFTYCIHGNDPGLWP